VGWRWIVSLNVLKAHEREAEKRGAISIGLINAKGHNLVLAVVREIIVSEFGNIPSSEEHELRH